MDSTESENFSIIVPIFHEAKNIPELIKRIAQINFGSRMFEVVLVDDDSRDGTEEIVHHLQLQYPWLRLLVRKEKKGLSESVLEGFQQAKYPVWVIMDADLSHPPEKIPQMLAALAESHVDFVVGSRYVPGGSSDEMWPLLRRASSRLAAFIARILVAVPVRDPLSGFLALKKEIVQTGDPIEPVGWKIGLEIMVKCRCRHIREVPIHFTQRARGVSKLNLRVIFNYFRHVGRLAVFKLFSVSS